MSYVEYFLKYVIAPVSNFYLRKTTCQLEKEMFLF